MDWNNCFYSIDSRFFDYATVQNAKFHNERVARISDICKQIAWYRLCHHSPQRYTSFITPSVWALEFAGISISTLDATD